MNCTNCGTENPPEAAFCMNCGHSLRTACANCGAELPDEAVFCMRCGHKVGEPAAEAVATQAEEPDERARHYMPDDLQTKLATEGGAMEGERRRVTMLFCDVRGSTTAAEKLDPEEWTDIMNGAYEHLIAPVYRYEGTLARLMGDAILAFFGAPIAHEDDPERAVMAGLEILEEIEGYRDEVLEKWGIELAVRVGINTGLVVVGAVGSDLHLEYSALGDAVNVAARMEQTAQASTVQISENTHRLVDQLFAFEDLGDFEVKGRMAPVRAYQVLGVLERPAITRGVEGHRAPLIGREPEVQAFREIFAGLEKGQGRIVSVIGEAGIGKSRLVIEMQEDVLSREGLEQLAWYQGRSLSYETGTPYTPIRGILASMLGLRGNESPPEIWSHVEQFVARAVPGRVSEVAPFLAQLLEATIPAEHSSRVDYLEPPQLRGEIHRSTVELVAGLAAHQPVVLSFEDLHWADSASIDLVLDLLSVAERESLLLLFAFRPARQDPSWRVHEAADRDYSHVYSPINLGPLTETDTRDLVGALLDIDALPDSVRNLILTKSEGNPFFVEEIIASMIDQEVIVAEGSRWIATKAVSDVAIPDSLSAVLTTRLDRLDSTSKDIAQAASVLGREFRYDEIASVLEDVKELDSGLLDLQRRELLREVSRVPKRVYRFKHALVQESAYETLLLKRRVQLHGAVAALLVRTQPERVEDIAEHYLRSRQEQQAIPFLLAAGERAVRSYVLPEAIAHLENALDYMAEGGDPDLLRRALEALGTAKELSFDLEGAASVYARLQAEGERAEIDPMRISGMNKKALVTGFFLNDREQALTELAEAEAMARKTNDGDGLIESCMFQCYLRTTHAEFDEVESYMKEITRLGEQYGQEEPTLFGMTHFANTLIFLTKFDEGQVEAEKAFAKAEETGNLKYQAELLTFALPICRLHTGDVEGALAALERGMEIALRIGDRESEVFGATMQGKFAMLAGDFDHALRLFQRVRDAAEAVAMPRLKALGKCVTGTCYLQIGGPMIERALEYHRETLELMESPGGSYGAWLWSEIGLCMLAAGKVDEADSLFDRALTEPTSPMHLMRPLALMGKFEVALARGRINDAVSWYGEFSEYVLSRQMQDYGIFVPFLNAQLQAAQGEHMSALEQLELAETIATMAGLKRMLLDINAAQAGSFEAVGEAEQAEAARAKGFAIADEISAEMSDPELRQAF
ncbi:MAG: adenylate/guanylate cyclase domain-containing protein, partial [Acidimicrobiia bacterium]